jgi:hypothetical protein
MVGKTPASRKAKRLFEELVMRSAHWVVAAALAAGAMVSANALEGEGLVPRARSNDWPRWQGRLSLGTTAPSLRPDASNPDGGGLSVTGLSLISDYYFTRSLAGAGDSGGFRATSGLLVGARSASFLSPFPSSGYATGRAFSVDRRNVGGFSLLPSIDASDPGAVPYVGVGYTGLSSKGGWGFSADIGVMALSPGSAVKFGRVFSGNQSLDDLLREMRLSPLVQVGVSYSF